MDYPTFSFRREGGESSLWSLDVIGYTWLRFGSPGVPFWCLARLSPRINCGGSGCRFLARAASCTIVHAQGGRGCTCGCLEGIGHAQAFPKNRLAFEPSSVRVAVKRNGCTRFVGLGSRSSSTVCRDPGMQSLMADFESGSGYHAQSSSAVVMLKRFGRYPVTTPSLTLRLSLAANQEGFPYVF